MAGQRGADMEEEPEEKGNCCPALDHHYVFNQAPKQKRTPRAPSPGCRVYRGGCDVVVNLQVTCPLREDGGTSEDEAAR